MTLPRTRAEMIERATQRLAELKALPEDWDSYGGQPTTDEAARLAAMVLDTLVRDDGPDPQLCPMVDGGVDIEWLVGGRYLSVESETRGRLNFYSEGMADNLEVEGLSVEEARPYFERAARMLAEMAPHVRFRVPS